MGIITKLHTMLKSGDISCFELAKEYLGAISRDNAGLNAYVNVTEDRALEDAKKADERFRSGDMVNPLLGIPMALKDNISTKGIETTCCSNILRDYTPIYDATVYTRLREHGAVLLGKANMDEFAMGNSCETSCFGTARNPYNTDFVPGGSSGGSAAAVAGNLAAFSLGSDTGGSVRQPGAFCSLVGLKPTYSAVSRYGLVAYASSLDQIGTLTDSVEDAAIVFDAIAGHDPLDSTSDFEYKANTFSALDNDIRGRTIGIPKQCLESLEEDVEKTFIQAVATFKSLGAKVIYVDMPELLYALPAYYILACAEASSNLGRYDGVRFGSKSDLYDSVHDMVCKTRCEGFGDETKRRILLGTYVLTEGYYNAYYKKAQALRHSIVAAYNRAFESCDVLMSPTVPHTAFRVGQATANPTESYQSDVCTVPVNMASLPAVSIPCGYDRKGMPVGLQLTGRKFCEDTILNFAYKFQQATDFARKTDWGVKL